MVMNDKDSADLFRAVVRIDQNVTSIKQDLLPPLARDTREARDKAREALLRISEHIVDIDAHDHDCEEKDRQAKQDSELATMSPKISWITKFVWWIIGIVGIGATSAVGFALTINSVTAANTEKISRNNEDIKTAIVNLDELRKSTANDSKEFARQIQRTMKDLKKNCGCSYGHIDIDTLNAREKRILNDIIKASKRRKQ